MSGQELTYLDANVIIRFVEGKPEAREPIRARLHDVQKIVTSQLSRLECRCFPIRRNDPALLSAYDTFFDASELALLDIDRSIIDIATQLRATHGFKSPDAIHLATAIACQASCFLTGDKQLTRCVELRVELFKALICVAQLRIKTAIRPGSTAR